MNIPLSSIEPFGVIGIPQFRWKRDDRIRQLIRYAVMMYRNIPLPILPCDIHMLEVLLVGRHGAFDISIVWVKEECQRGYHRFRFRMPDDPSRLITAYLHPAFGTEIG
jgi:hypothetical protein